MSKPARNVLLFMGLAMTAAGCGLALGLDDLEKPVPLEDGDAAGEELVEGLEEDLSLPELDDPDGSEGEDAPADGEPEEPGLCVSVSGNIFAVRLEMQSVNVAGTSLALFSGDELVMDPDPVPLVTGFAGAGPNPDIGTFSFGCVDVTDSMFGLVLVVDDNPASTDDVFFSTGSPVALWDILGGKVDVDDADAFVLTNAMANRLASLSSMDPAAGFVMGRVVGGMESIPIQHASVTFELATASVYYPSVDFLSLLPETDGTSLNGFFFTGPVTGFGTITAAFMGLTFPDILVATVAGSAYFVLLTGT